MFIQQSPVWQAGQQIMIILKADNFFRFLFFADISGDSIGSYKVFLSIIIPSQFVATRNLFFYINCSYFNVKEICLLYTSPSPRDS